MAPRKTRGGGTPDAVKKAADAANELHKEVYGGVEPDTQEEAAQDATAPGEDETAAGGDIQPVETPAPTDSTANTDPSAPPPADPVEVTPSNDTPPDPVVDWEGKYRVLQGKYNAEVPRLNNEIRELRAAVQTLQEAQKAPPKAQEAEEEKESVVSEQDLVDYGDDLVDLIRRVARAEAAEKTKDLTPRIEEIRGQVQESQAQQVTNTVYSKLDDEVQDWKEINKSPDFVGWLQDRDPYTGATRQDLLSDAFAQGDGHRVVAFFKGYLAEQQAVTPQPTPQVDLEPQPQVRLEDLAGPASGTNGSTAPSQQPTAPQWTRASIAKFYSDVHKGHYEKNPQRKAQIEASIAQAMAAGAIQ